LRIYGRHSFYPIRIYELKDLGNIDAYGKSNGIYSISIVLFSLSKEMDKALRTQDIAY